MVGIDSAVGTVGKSPIHKGEMPLTGQGTSKREVVPMNDGVLGDDASGRVDRGRIPHSIEMSLTLTLTRKCKSNPNPNPQTAKIPIASLGSGEPVTVTNGIDRL